MRVHSHFSTNKQFGLRLTSACEAPLSPKDRTTLERALTTTAQKVVGLEDGIAASTVTSSLQRSFRQFGLACNPSRVPFLVVVAASRTVSGAPFTGVIRKLQRADNHIHTIVTLHSPNAWLATRLSPGEAHVAASRLQGMTHAEMAANRARRPRTIANLLANAYRKLSVSTRFELMQLLLTEYQKGNVPLPADDDSDLSVRRRKHCSKHSRILICCGDR